MPLSHAEDQKGASVQTMLPLNLPVTTYKLCTDKNAFAVHSGIAVGNVGLDRGCRTKLAGETSESGTDEGDGYLRGR